ncbi:MAG: hypothetical protein QNJ98_01175 [Planctomycetota bacterium]|nr:hypothetical protein [Planctomycetota bacterium]
MRHILFSLPILLVLAACGGSGGGADASLDDAPAIDAIDAERIAAEELALILDLVRGLEMGDAMDLADEIVFDIVRIDPADPLGETDDSIFPDPLTFDGFGDGERKDGLPAGAPPSGWGTGGLTSSNATVTKDAETGTVTKTWSWTTTDRDGAETRHTRRESDGPAGRTSSHTTTHSQGGIEVTERRAKRPNGTLVHEEWVSVPHAGTGSYRSWSRSPDGTVLYLGAPIVDHVVQSEGFHARTPRNGPFGEAPPLWLQDNPGDDGTVWWQQALADWVWRQHRLGRHSPRGTDGRPVHSNPEDPDYDGGLPTGPTVWDYVASGDLVVNPDPTNPTLASHPPSGRAAEILRDILRGYGQGATPGGAPGGGGGR